MKNLIFAVLFFGTLGFAQENPSDRGWFAGLTVGLGTLDTDILATAERQNEPFDDEDVNLGIIAGYMWNTYFGMEGGVLDLGTYTALRDGQNYKYDVHGFKLMAIGRLPVGERLAFIGKAGAISSRTKERVNLGFHSFSETEEDTSSAFEAGIQFKINPKWIASIQYGTYDLALIEFDWTISPDDDITVTTVDVNKEVENVHLGIQYRF